MNPSGSASRILVVDDEPKICEFIRALLERDGHAVDTAVNGEAALESLRERPSDLLLCDLKMPGMDGFELARRAKELDAHLPVVIMTGFATLGTAVEAMRRGVDDYVTKPFKLEEMRRVVSNALERARAARRRASRVAELETVNTELERRRGALEHEVRSAAESLERVNEDLRRRVAELALLHEVATAAAREIEVDRLLADCAALAAEKIAAGWAAVFLRSGGRLLLRAGTGGPAEQAAAAVHVVAEHVAAGGETVWIDDRHDDPRFGEAVRGAGRSLVCVPIVFKGEALGVVCAADKRGGAFSDNEVAVLRTIANQIAPTIENARLRERLEENALLAVRALVAALEARDPYTSGHSQRVTRYAGRIARALNVGESDLRTLERASQLHDIGKLGVSDLILHKRSSLRADEARLVREHPVLGERIMRPLGFLFEAAAVVRDHHERPDGAGYPDGKRGDQIHRLARIMSVADAFDAMTSDRPYRPAKSVHAAREEIAALRGRQFDEEAAEAFCAQIGSSGLGPTPEEEGRA